MTPRSSKKRALLLDVTEKLMLDEGYAAVTFRSVAARAGMNASLVYYYFPTLDDLLVAVLRRSGRSYLQRLAAALASEEPLRSVWNLITDRLSTAIFLEMAAAANHRKVVQTEIVDLTEQFQCMLIEAFRKLLETYPIDVEEFPPELVVIVMEGMAHLIVNQQSLGVKSGHDEALSALDRCLQRLEDGRKRYDGASRALGL
jgi:AcrR family transcriptional regulator